MPSTQPRLPGSRGSSSSAFGAEVGSDVAAVAAVALTADGDERGTWTLTGPEALTYGDVAAHLSVLLGRSIEYVDVPDEQARSALRVQGAAS